MSEAMILLDWNVRLCIESENIISTLLVLEVV